MKNSLIALMLVILFIIPSNISIYALADVPHAHYDTCNKTPAFYSGKPPEVANPYGSGDTVFDDLRSVLPLNTKPMIKNPKTLNPTLVDGLRLNYKLWHDKGIVVYGDYKATPYSTKGNYIDQTQTYDGTPKVVDGGYYYVSEYKSYGEYRYHGYDAAGNLYTNINFPNDANSSKKLSKKDWLYQIWNNSNPNLRQEISPWNDAAIKELNAVEKLKTQQWINALFKNWGVPANEAIEYGKLPDNATSTTSSQNKNELYNFVHVLTPPTPLTGGEGRMWHKTSDDKVWYQTFSIPKVQNIKTGTAECIVTILNESELKSTIPLKPDDTSQDSWPITAKVRVSGKLIDEAYYNDVVKKVIYYTRNDIKSSGGWDITLDGSSKSNVVGNQVTVNINTKDNIAYADFTRIITIGEAKALTNGKKTFNGSIKVNMVDNGVVSAHSNKDAIIALKTPTPPQRAVMEDPPPTAVIPKPNLPKPAFDIVKYTPTDNTDMADCVSRTVRVNGVVVDDVEFFSGNWVWGDGNDGLKYIEIEYLSTDDTLTGTTVWLYVYPTKPNAHYTISGSYKQNRVMNFTDSSYGANIQIVVDAFPINHYEWSYRTIEGGAAATVKYKDISQLQKKIMYKEPGTYEVELTVTNTLGRRSDPYKVDFTIFEDYKPAIICNLDNSVMARNEAITANVYEAVSTDGDIISSNKVELLYDSNNDGAYDELVNTWNNITVYPTYTPTKLGRYKFVNTVTEAFGEETFPEFIVASDYKQSTSEREFFVDNYVPMTDIYIDIPIVRTYVDAYFMLDQNLNPTKLQYVIDNRMNINNTLRSKNLVAKVENWDLHTYTYSQPASTTINSGTSYPSATTSYSSSGYSGTLSRISVSDNGGNEDHGRYQNNTESSYFSDSWTNNSSSSGWTNPWTVDSSSSNPAPGSMYVSSDGYSGSIPRTGTVENYNTGTVYGTPVGGRTPWSSSSSYTAYYGGTLTKTVQTWIPNIVWVPNYTGFYSGTIYKNVKAPYVDPFVTTHKKYTIYVSDGPISNMADLNMIKNNHNAKLVLIGNAASASQIASDYFILNDGTQSISELVNKVTDWIAEQNPYAVEGYITTQNQAFNIYIGDFDQEGDTITNPLFQYVHNKDHFDNPTGQEVGTQTAFNDAVGWTASKKDRFANVGKYTIYRKIQDIASSDPNFSEFNKTSGTPYLEVLVHRIPIANPAMTWKYNAASSLYELTFADSSYDLDHQNSHPTKGIIETQIRYRKDAGDWHYMMPTNLPWGNYTVEYYVKDLEQAWSLPYTMNITLSQVPPANITIESTTVQKDVRMRGDTTIPSSEVLLITSPDLTSGPIIHSNVPITTAEVFVNASKVSNLQLTLLGNQTEYVYNSNIFEYLIPQSQGDGNVNITIRATTNIGNQSKDSNHVVPVYTPIWESYNRGSLSYISHALDGIDSTMELSLNTNHDKLNELKVVTSKYTSKIQVSIGGIIYYIFKNDMVGLNSSGVGAASSLTVNSTYKYKVQDIAVNTNSNEREWKFKLSVVNNYPLKLNQPSIISIIGYDEAGSATTTSNKHNYNPQSKTITPNNYLIYNFRVVKVRDLYLQSYYKNHLSGVGQPLYIDKPVFASGMAIDSTNFGNMIDGLTKGYMFEFEIDSQNFNESADEIIIEPHFYTTDAFARDNMERDLYWEDSNHHIIKVGDGGHSAWKKITLTAPNRTIKTGEEATWRGEYLIPGTAWAVPKGTLPTQAKIENLKRDIIVSFHIKGYKDGVLQFDYNEEQWGKERAIEKYPYLIGDVIRYSWDKNCLNDINAKDNR